MLYSKWVQKGVPTNNLGIASSGIWTPVFSTEKHTLFRFIERRTNAATAPTNVPDTQALLSSGEGASVLASTLSDEELQMLQALQFDDYRHMTIAEFQNKVWEKTDTQWFMASLTFTRMSQ